jgi:hypothetical protein
MPITKLINTLTTLTFLILTSQYGFRRDSGQIHSKAEDLRRDAETRPACLPGADRSALHTCTSLHLDLETVLQNTSGSLWPPFAICEKAFT